MSLAERYRVRFPSVTVPANVVSVLEIKGQERTIVLVVPGHPHPFLLHGDDAEAWLAYEEGRIECPPNVNGVRDIIGAYAARVEAKATLGQTAHPSASVGQEKAFQEPSTPLFTFDPDRKEIDEYQKEQDRPDRIDWDRLRKRLNDASLAEGNAEKEGENA